VADDERGGGHGSVPFGQDATGGGLFGFVMHA
jgi:hypothetical protein